MCVHERGFPFLVETGPSATGGDVFVGGGMVSLVLVRLLHVSEGRDAMFVFLLFFSVQLGCRLCAVCNVMTDQSWVDSGFTKPTIKSENLCKQALLNPKKREKLSSGSS